MKKTDLLSNIFSVMHLRNGKSVIYVNSNSKAMKNTPMNPVVNSENSNVDNFENFPMIETESDLTQNMMPNTSTSNPDDASWEKNTPRTVPESTHAGISPPNNTPLNVHESNYLQEEEERVRYILGLPPRQRPPVSQGYFQMPPVTAPPLNLNRTTFPNHMRHSLPNTAQSTTTTLNHNAPLFVPPVHPRGNTGERLAVFSNLSSSQPESSTDILLKTLLTKLDGLNLRPTISGAMHAPVQNDSISRLEQVVSSLGSQVQSLTQRLGAMSSSDYPENGNDPPFNSEHHHRSRHHRHESRTSPPPTHSQPRPGQQHSPSPPRSRANNHSHHGDTYRIMPHKWKVWYNGNNNKFPIEFFFDQLEILRVSSGLEYGHVISGLPHLLSDEPARWFVRYSKQNPGVQWNQLKKDMIEQFRGIDSEESLWCSIANKKQQPHETFDFFYSSLQNLQDRISISFTDAQMIGILSNNVRYDIQKCLVSYSTPSLTEFVNKCRQVDKLLHPHLYVVGAANSRKVSELQPEFDSEEQSFGVEAFVPKRGNSSDVVKCWNCERNGHRFKDCEEPRRMFCYLCGYPNVTCTKCPACSQKPNFRQPASASHHVPPSTELNNP